MTLRLSLPALALLACQSPPSLATVASGNSVVEKAPAALTSAAVPAAATLPLQAASSVAPEASIASKRHNVLFLTVDSLRADMPWQGYPRKIAPNLEALAAKSTVYTQAYSLSSYTAKSVSGFLSGRYPSSIYRSGWFFAGFPDSNLFFPELLQQAKVRTLGFHGHMYFDRGKGFNQGFDVWELAPGLSFNATTDKAVTSDKLTDLAIHHLSDSKNSGGQFFLWIHYMDPHDEYLKHAESPDFGKTNRDRYDSEVFYTDLHIGRLLDFGKQQAWWDNTVVVLSADHGETFGEHGMYKHAFELWEVLTHVPLIVYVPGAKPQTIASRRSALDLAPTILELMGEKPAPEMQGLSLKPELLGAPPVNREPIVLDLPEDKNNPDRHAIIAGDFKLISQNYGNRWLLFNLKEDPAELNDLSRKTPEKLKEMRELYARAWEKIPLIEPFGGMKLASGKVARGSEGPVSSPTASETAKH